MIVYNNSSRFWSRNCSYIRTIDWSSSKHITTILLSLDPPPSSICHLSYTWKYNIFLFHNSLTDLEVTSLPPLYLISSVSTKFASICTSARINSKSFFKVLLHFVLGLSTGILSTVLYSNICLIFSHLPSKDDQTILTIYIWSIRKAIKLFIDIL